MSSYTFNAVITASGIVDMKSIDEIVDTNNIFFASTNAPNIYDIKGFTFSNTNLSTCSCLAWDDQIIYVGFNVGILSYIMRIYRAFSNVFDFLLLNGVVSGITDIGAYGGYVFFSKSNLNVIYYVIATAFPFIGSGATTTVTPLSVPVTPIIVSNVISLDVLKATDGTRYLYYTSGNTIYSINLPINIFGSNGTTARSATASTSITCITNEPGIAGLPNVYLVANQDSGGRGDLFEAEPTFYNDLTITLNPPSTDPIRAIAFDKFAVMYIANSTTVYQSVGAFCFNEGTKILYLNKESLEEYVPIEDLKIGDYVKTYKHEYRKISKVISGTLRNNPNQWNMCMYKMAKTDSNGLLEDLIVTGGHSLLVDSITEEQQSKYDEMGLTEFSKERIDGKRLLIAYVSDQFIAMPDQYRYTYYHLLLDNDNDEEARYGIWANGILTETPNEKTLK